MNEIPESEKWLWENRPALDMVLEGIRQAKSGESVDGPDLDEDAKQFDMKDTDSPESPSGA